MTLPLLFFQIEPLPSIDRARLPVYLAVYTSKGIGMKTAKIFRSGNSQAVRIPKEFQLEGDEVEILKRAKTFTITHDAML